MQRTKEAKPILNIKRGKTKYIPEKTELIKLLSSYIKESAKRDEIYTSLMKLKSSIT
jgi:hypothetical protein